MAKIMKKKEVEIKTQKQSCRVLSLHKWKVFVCFDFMRYIRLRIQNYVFEKYDVHI